MSSGLFKSLGEQVQYYKISEKNPKYWTWNFGMFPDDVDGMYRGMKVCNL